MRDFTLKKYRQLLEALLQKGYEFIRFDEFMEGEKSNVKSQKSVIDSQQSSMYQKSPKGMASQEERSGKEEAGGSQRPFHSPDEPNCRQGRLGRAAQGDKTLSPKRIPLCILRHDVDLLPKFALNLARLEKELDIRGTYYFRIIPETFNINYIKQIEELGNEIGYHYEEMDSPLLISPQRGENDLEKRIDKAYELFKKNLEKMRSVAAVKTICMHGSPLSKFDNKLIWSKYNYRDLGIIGEPYFDIDWNEFGYLTDTGRRWNGNSFNIRDKVDSKYNLRFKKTQQIIKHSYTLPDKMMITIHPQRWSDNWLDWTIELIAQNVKNIAKYAINRSRGN